MRRLFNLYLYFSAVDASCVNCLEKMEKLKNPDFIKPKKSLTSDFPMGTFNTIK